MMQRQQLTGWLLAVVLPLAGVAPTAVGQPSAAVTYFVAPTGNDAWSGKLAAPNDTRTDGPFATLPRARAALRTARQQAKATGAFMVQLRGGRYELAEPLVFTPADSGTADSPTQFSAFPGEQPVLSGGKQIRGWKKAENVWTASLPGKQPWLFRHISVNGEWRQRPRWPRKGVFTVTGLAGADPRAKYNTPANRFEFKEGEIRADWKNLSAVEAVVLHFWVDTHLQIAAVDPDRHIVTFDRFSRRRFTDDYRKSGARYYLSNVFAAFTEPGTFYLDSPVRTLHYRPALNEDHTSALVVAPQLDHLIRFEGEPGADRFVEHIELQGLTFADCTWQPPAKEAVDAQAASVVPGAIRLRGARHCGINNCRLTNLESYGIELLEGCRHNRLVGNHLEQLGAGGIRLSGGADGSPQSLRTGANLITDNHLHHLGEIWHSGVGILLQHADNNTIAYNHIHHLYYTGISAGWVWGYAPSVSQRNRIEHNRIHDVGQQLLSDMGGIYLLGAQPGTVVRGNVIHEVDSWSYGGWGIYTDEGSSQILIENNLVYRTKSGGFHQHYGKENVVRNNIFALAREEQLARSRAEPHLSFTFERNIVYFKEGPLFGKNWKDDRFTIDHNLYWNAAGKPIGFPGGSLEKWRARGHDRHSLVAEPKFRDPERGDFTLAEDSPALRIGFRPFDWRQAGPRPREKRP